MSPLRTTLFTLFALTTTTISTPLTHRTPTGCLESSTASTVTWQALAPFTWYYGSEATFSWGNFYLHNGANEVTSYCYTTNDTPYGILTGRCQTPVVKDVWNNLRDTGVWRFDSQALEVEVRQNWTCAGEGGKGAAFTGTALFKLPKKTESGWECLPIEGQGQQRCNYTVPNALTPKVTILGMS